MNTLRELPGQHRINCNIRDLDEAGGHSERPCVGQERKQDLSQGSDCQSCHMGGENPETAGKWSSRVFSPACYWGVFGASNELPSQLSSEQLHWAMVTSLLHT